MIQGRKYYFVYRSDTHRKDRVSILNYLDQSNEDFILDARPYAGTQHLPKKWVKSIRLAQSYEPLTIGGRVLK